MTEKISSSEWKELLHSVFPARKQDRGLAILLDVPDKIIPDHAAWQARRTMAARWKKDIEDVKSDLNLEKVSLVLYPNVHSNNADLPDKAYIYEGDHGHVKAADLQSAGNEVPMEKVLS